jgi:hypothetical protein
MRSADRAHDLPAEEWETPGRTPIVLSVLRELYLKESGRIHPGWLNLIRALGDVRATIAVAVPAGNMALAIVPRVELQDAPVEIDGHRVAPNLWGTAGRFASDLAQRADEMRVHYARLAQHLLEAAAGRVAPGEMPQFAVMGTPEFSTPTLSVPEELAGFVLREVRVALPVVGVGSAEEREVQSVVWSDLVCESLAGELRPVLRPSG